MLDQGGDILQNHGETRLQFRGILVALEQVGEQPLLVHDVLPDPHRVLLQLVDVQEEVLVDVLLLVDPLAVLRDLLAHKLDHIRIQVDTLVHDAREHRIAILILLRHRNDPPLQFSEAAQGNLAQGGQTIAHEGEGNGLDRVILRARHQEVGVREDRFLRLGETGRTLDFLRLGAAGNLNAKEVVDGMLFVPGRGEKVDPKDLILIHLEKLRFRLRYQQFAVLSVEDNDHTLPVFPGPFVGRVQLRVPDITEKSVCKNTK